MFVNDNYGEWNTSAEQLFKRACAGERPDLIEPLQPDDGDAFVIKARRGEITDAESCKFE